MVRIGLSDAFVCVPVFREYPCSVSGCGDVFAAAFCLQTDRQRLMMSSAFFAAASCAALNIARAACFVLLPSLYRNSKHTLNQVRTPLHNDIFFALKIAES